MEQTDVLFALGSQNGWRVANALNTAEWRTASEVARELDVQVATAVTHLKRLAEVGVAENRIRKGRRDALEYRLLDTGITIRLRLGQADGCTMEPETMVEFIRQLSEVLGADYVHFEETLPKKLRALALRTRTKGEWKGSESETTQLMKQLVSHAIEKLGRRGAQRRGSTAYNDRMSGR